MGGHEDVVLGARERRSAGAQFYAPALLRSRAPALHAFRVPRFAFLILGGNNKRSFPQHKSLLDGFRQPRTHPCLILEPINDDGDMMLDLAVKLEVIGEADDLAVNTSADETAPKHVLEEVLVFPLLAANDRGEDEEARSRGQSHDAGDDLFAGLGGNFPAALGAMSLADAREQHAQVIVDFRDGADRRTRVFPPRLLLDADGRRQTGKKIDVRLVHLPQKLPGISRQRFHVAALSFRIQRIEGERAFARAGDAGEDDQAIAGQLEIDVLQIVLAGAANDKGAVLHTGRCCSWDGWGPENISIVIAGWRVNVLQFGYYCRPVAGPG